LSATEPIWLTPVITWFALIPTAPAEAFTSRDAISILPKELGREIRMPAFASRDSMVLPLRFWMLWVAWSRCTVAFEAIPPKRMPPVVPNERTASLPALALADSRCCKKFLLQAPPSLVAIENRDL